MVGSVLASLPGNKGTQRQPDNGAAVHVAIMDSPSSNEQQPAEAPMCHLDVPADAGSLQRLMSHDCADEEALGADAWLTPLAQRICTVPCPACSMQTQTKPLKALQQGIQTLTLRSSQLLL